MDIQTLMASTVHDVKNSLGFIESQLTNVVKRIDGQDPTSADEIRRIQLECARINNGMVHMLGLYRMQAGQLAPDFDEVLVTDVIEFALSRHTPVLNALAVEVTVSEPEKGFDGLWYMDSNLVEGILSNVVTNSIRYTDSRLEFLVREVDGWLNIRILDDGDGFPDSMLKMLDQPETLCFHSGATGLGLYFCQQIAQMHTNGERKGYIQLSNCEGSKGAIFDLWLP